MKYNKERALENSQAVKNLHTSLLLCFFLVKISVDAFKMAVAIHFVITEILLNGVDNAV